MVFNVVHDFFIPWVSVVVTALCCWQLYNGITYLVGLMRTMKVIKRKQTEREAQFRRLEKQSKYQLNSAHEKILALTNDELISQLQNRKLTATEVQEAFMAKTLKVTREFNMVTEFIPQAQDWAQELDSLKVVKGPLHGLPISIKDNCNIQGMDSTIGLAKYCYQPAKETAAVVKSMMALGAVPFCKTNLPQTVFSFGCANPVYGLTKNYLNKNLSPGGSSGGESSLIAAGGSRIGIGSDIGGSVRIPAHFTGVVGFKPTKNRFSGIGFRGCMPNVVGLLGVPGLLAYDVGILSKMTKHMLEGSLQNKFDPFALPIPWDQQVFESKTKLRIGYFTSLPYWPLFGDTEDVVLKAKAALESQGHTLVPFEMPDSFAMMDLVFDFAFADRGEYLLMHWKHEPIPASIIGNYLICKSSMWLRKVLVLLMKCSWLPIHSKRIISIIGRGANSTKDLWSRMGDRQTMTQDLLTSWKKANLDLLLTPTYPTPAIPHNMPGRLQSSVFYTMIWNLFDFPCGVVKFGTESGTKVEGYDHQGDMVLKVHKQGARAGVGMPISVQIVGLPYQEELVLRGMTELESVSKLK